VNRYVRTAGSQVHDFEQRSAGRRGGYGGLKARRSPDQELNQLLFGRCAGNGTIGDDPAVAHDADVVGNFQHLAQVMRNVQDRRACVAQTVD
jgi:hypothetical protein